MGRTFNGSSDQAVISGSSGSPIDITGSQMSASCWMYLTANPTHEVDPLCKWSSAGTGGYFLGYNESGHSGQITAAIYINISLNHLHNIFAPNTISLNTWYQMAFRYQASLNMELWLNGVKVATDNSVGSGGLMVTSGNNLLFGAPRPSITGSNFPGVIAECAVWNVYLSSGEMTSLGTVAPKNVRRTALVGYWPFAGVASPEPDLSGNILNATLTGTTAGNHPPVTNI